MAQVDRNQDGKAEEDDRRAAILRAAGEVFTERGYEAATTLEIATRARTSKRALYQHFGSKQAILAALIRESSARMSAPLDLPMPESPTTFYATLRAFGLGFLKELVAPPRIALYRLAIAEAQRSGSVARELDRGGRARVVEAAARLFRHGAARGFYAPDAVELMTVAFFNILIGPLQVGLLLGVEPPPTERTLEQRVAWAVSAVEKIARP